MSKTEQEIKAEAWEEGVQDCANRNALPEAETVAMLAENPYIVKTVYKTFEERIAFEKKWDARVEAGRKK